MILTLEIPFNPPIRPVASHANPPAADPLTTYESRFGALPDWLDQLPTNTAQHLTRQALSRGEPLTAAEYLE